MPHVGFSNNFTDFFQALRSGTPSLDLTLGRASDQLIDIKFSVEQRVKNKLLISETNPTILFAQKCAHVKCKNASIVAKIAIVFSNRGRSTFQYHACNSSVEPRSMIIQNRIVMNDKRSAAGKPENVHVVHGISNVGQCFNYLLNKTAEKFLRLQ